MRCSVEEAVTFGRKLKEVFDHLNAAAAEQLERALGRQPRDPLKNDVSYSDLIFSLFNVGKALQQVANALDAQSGAGPVYLSLPVEQQLAQYEITPPLKIWEQPEPSH